MADRWSVLPAVCCALLGVCSEVSAAVKHLQSDEATEVAYLIRAGTVDSLATASLLAHLTQTSDEEQAAGAAPGPDPSQLINRAVAMAPGRPALVWLQLRDCESRHCPDGAKIASRLRDLDPDNGLAWLADLNEVQSESADEITQFIDRMGAARTPRVYWNELAAMMFDALTHRDRSKPPTAITVHADDRLTHVTGVLAAVDIPSFRPFARACGPDQLELAVRRAACEKAASRLEASDAVITQNLRFSLQERWLPPGSLEYRALQRDRLQRRYQTVASNRLRKGHADRDAEMRVDAMRHLAREEDVERAMLAAFHEPLERPPGWLGPNGAE